MHNTKGAMLWHLGMSGRVVQRPSMQPEEKHTHAVFQFEPAICLHFIDPRRFGSILWVPKDAGHPLLDHLGPDPFSEEATPELFKERARTCKGPIKGFLMRRRRLWSGVCRDVLLPGSQRGEHVSRAFLFFRREVVLFADVFAQVE